MPMRWTASRRPEQESRDDREQTQGTEGWIKWDGCSRSPFRGGAHSDGA